ncbi:MAG: methylenetetrahydrofolate reductase [Clostridiales bacterium]|jgi:methylenetetrahydrofolate reductase (NADPH)|nr:methylenetetrahydrofolate reductase [Clostridiales bacterium]
MRISDVIRQKSDTLSFEIFPPKVGVEMDIGKIAERLVALKPDFISVTNSAGGSGGTGTLEIAQTVKNTYGVESIMHLVCSGATRESIARSLDCAAAAHIDNILALRGDKLNGDGSGFCHASDLIRLIDKKKFCVGAAAYPEGHIDAPDLDTDIEYLKLKVECGADFLTTQLFFDNEKLYSFMDKLRDNGITVPVLCGIMPILSKSQVKRMSTMCGVSVTEEVARFIDRYEDPADICSAGVEYAQKQIRELRAHGMTRIHLYTMNKPEIAEEIVGGQ